MTEPPGRGHDVGMQSSLLADDDLPDAASLVSSVTRRATPGHYDEWSATASGSRLRERSSVTIISRTSTESGRSARAAST